MKNSSGSKSQGSLKNTSKNKHPRKKPAIAGSIGKKKVSKRKKKFQPMDLAKITPFTANKFHHLETDGLDNQKKDKPKVEETHHDQPHHPSKEELTKELIKEWTKKSPKKKKSSTKVKKPKKVKAK